MNRLTLSELTDQELISDMTFWIVINAFLIRRYGAGMLIIPGCFTPPVRTLGATIPENGSHLPVAYSTVFLT